MSRKLVALVYTRKAGSLLRKALLSYMADRASDDGTGIWASKRRIAAEIEASRRAVISNIQKLVDEKLLIEVGKKRHKNGWTMEYKLDVKLLSDLPISDPEDPCKIAHLEDAPVNPVHPTRESSSPQDVNPVHPNRPVTVHEQSNSDELDLTPENTVSKPKRKVSPRGSARGSRIDPNWNPGPEGYAFAAKHGFSQEEINHEAAQFVDYWLGVSGQRGVKLDWQATWRNRIRAQAKYRAEREGANATSGNRNQAFNGKRPTSGKAAAAMRLIDQLTADCGPDGGEGGYRDHGPDGLDGSGEDCFDADGTGEPATYPRVAG